MILKYMPLVYKLARQTKTRCPPEIALEDLVGYGMLGLVDAANRYDSSRGASFHTFAWYRINGSIMDGLRKLSGMKRGLLRKLKVGTIPPIVFEPHSAESLIAPIVSGLELHATRQALIDAISILTDMQKRVLILVAVYQVTFEECGIMHNKTKSWAHKTFKASIDKMRSVLVAR